MIQITERIKQIQYMLEHRRYDSARVLLESLIADESKSSQPKPHVNGLCWCGQWHQDK
jgi:hypothetical protein